MAKLDATTDDEIVRHMIEDAYDWEKDALGSYHSAMKAIGAKAKETGIIPECLLGDGEHSAKLRKRNAVSRSPEAAPFFADSDEQSPNCIYGIGSNGTTVALTLWAEDDRVTRLVKIMTPHEAIVFAERVLREAVKLLDR